MNTLLTGGLAAAAVAAWSQVKSTFSYLSSFVVIQATLDGESSEAMNRELKTNWIALPSGQVYYKSWAMYFVGQMRATRVPYKLRMQASIYRKGWRFMFVHDDGHQFKISYLRGTIDFDQLLLKALKAEDDRANSGLSTSGTAFYVTEHIGRDKSGMSFSYQGSNEPSPSAGSSGSQLSASSSHKPRLDTSIDDSYAYDRSLWQWTDHDDPFENLYFSDRINKHIERAIQWMAKRKWYEDRGIPWRRGWLLHGPGGTGKTSLATAVAQKLSIPLHLFYLSTMSDQEFIREWGKVNFPAMILFEDFDGVFHGREPQGNCQLSFDVVLNKISGAATNADGLFLVISTNDISKIDPAIGINSGDDVSTRPGRIDTVIEVSTIGLIGRLKMASRILKDWPEDIDRMVHKHTAVTPAQFQELCLQLALKKIAESEKEENAKDCPNSGGGNGGMEQEASDPELCSRNDSRLSA